MILLKIIKKKLSNIKNDIINAKNEIEYLDKKKKNFELSIREKKNEKEIVVGDNQNVHKVMDTLNLKIKDLQGRVAKKVEEKK